MKFTIIPLALMLSACASHTPIPVCPEPVPYTAEQQNQAADELEALPPGSILPRFMQDYGILRAQVRACQ